MVHNIGFKTTKVWNDAIDLLVNVYSITRTGALSKDYGFKDQLQRATVSISSNIAEGYSNKKDKTRFIRYAIGSADEVMSLINGAHRIGYITEDDMTKIENQCSEICSQLSGFVRHIENRTLES